MTWSSKLVAVAAGALFLLPLCGSFAEPAGATAPSPLPETASQQSWTERQRARYLNTPLINKAHAAIAAGDYASAERDLLGVLQNDPRNNQARIYLIEVYEHLQKWEAGIAISDSLLTDYPDYLDGYAKKGFLAVKSGNDPVAVSAFETLLGKAPAGYRRLTEAQKALAEIYYRKGQYDRAKLYGQLRLGREGSVDAHLFLYECCMKLNDTESALKHLDQALALTNLPRERGEIQLRRGYMLAHLQRYAESDESLAEAEKLLPKEVAPQMEAQMGINAYAEKAYAKAAEHFKARLSQSFDERAADQYLQSLAAAEHWELARTEARRFLTDNRVSDAFAESTLNMILQADSRLGDNLSCYLTAQQLHARFSNPRYRLEAAMAAEHLAQTDEAIRLYRLYLKDQFDPAAALNYCYLLKSKGMTSDLVDVLGRILATPALDETTKRMATYELAQVSRQEKRMDIYFKLMDEIVKQQPESKFLQEYAVQLYGSGRLQQAVETYTKSLETESNPAEKMKTCMVLGDIYLTLQKPAEARAWLTKAREFGQPPQDWHLAMAKADFQEGKYKDCVDRLLPLAKDQGIYHLYLAYSFYKLGMPGLALYHMNQVSTPEKFTPQEQFNLFSNRSYLDFDQEQHDAGMVDLDRALAYQKSDELRLVRLKTLLHLNRFDDVIEAGEDLISGERDADLKAEFMTFLRDHPDAKLREDVLNILGQSDARFKAEVMAVIAESYFRSDRPDEAIRCFTDAMDLDPHLIEPLYLRGLSHYKKGDLKEAEEDLMAYYDRTSCASNTSALFWADVGILEGALKDYDLGTAALRRSIEIFPMDVKSREESSYQYMKWAKNDSAQSNLVDVIDCYEEILPYLEGDDYDEYRANQLVAKRENSKLDKTWGVQAYFNKTEFDNNTTVPITTIEGALPSEAGIQASYRPPVIGLRNERSLDVFGRVLANFKRKSWSLDQDSYQGSIGAIYKPFVTWNANVSIERLFKIGDNSEDNWLWRNMAGWEHGEKPAKDKTIWPYGSAYGEISYYLDEPRRWFYYLDGRLGPAFLLPGRILAVFPQGMGVLRHQSNDDTHTGSYWMYGIGANFRVLEPERQYVIERWYADLFVHYVWGQFKHTPEGADGSTFKGLIVGVNFVK